MGPEIAQTLLRQADSDVIIVSDEWRFPFSLGTVTENAALDRKIRSQVILPDAINEFSHARRMQAVVEIVRHETRRLSDAVGFPSMLIAPLSRKAWHPGSMSAFRARYLRKSGF